MLHKSFKSVPPKLQSQDSQQLNQQQSCTWELCAFLHEYWNQVRWQPTINTEHTANTETYNISSKQKQANLCTKLLWCNACRPLAMSHAMFSSSPCLSMLSWSLRWLRRYDFTSPYTTQRPVHTALPQCSNNNKKKKKKTHLFGYSLVRRSRRCRLCGLISSQEPGGNGRQSRPPLGWSRLAAVRRWRAGRPRHVRWPPLYNHVTRSCNYTSSTCYDAL